MRLLALLLLVCSSAHAATAYQSFGELTWQGELDWSSAWVDDQVSKGDTFGAYNADGQTVFTEGPGVFTRAQTLYWRDVFIPAHSTVTFSVLATIQTTDKAQADAALWIGSNQDQLAGCLTSLGESCEQSRTLTVTHRNDSDEAQAFDIALFERRNVDTWSQNEALQAAPIPEPESWALMLAGLVALTRLARGRLPTRSGSLSH